MVITTSGAGPPPSSIRDHRRMGSPRELIFPSCDQWLPGHWEIQGSYFGARYWRRCRGRYSVSRQGSLEVLVNVRQERKKHAESLWVTGAWQVTRHDSQTRYLGDELILWDVTCVSLVQSNPLPPSPSTIIGHYIGKASPASARMLLCYLSPSSTLTLHAPHEGEGSVVF